MKRKRRRRKVMNDDHEENNSDLLPGSIPIESIKLPIDNIQKTFNSLMSLINNPTYWSDKESYKKFASKKDQEQAIKTRMNHFDNSIKKKISLVEKKNELTNDFDRPRMIAINIMFENLPTVLNTISILYDQVCIHKRPIKMEHFRILTKKYNTWLTFFLMNFNSCVYLSYKDKYHVTTLSFHFYLLLAKLQKILMVASPLENPIERHKVWFFTKFDQQNYTEKEKIILNRLPSFSNELTPSHLEYLPLYLQLPKIRNIPFLKMKLSQTLQLLTFLFHNQSIDYEMFNSNKKRIHILYYIELLLIRLSEFVIETQDEKYIIGMKGYSSLLSGVYQTNLRCWNTVIHLFHYFKFTFAPNKRWNDGIKYFKSKRCLSLDNNIRLQHQIWNPQKNASIIYKMMSTFLKNVICSQKVTLSNFFGKTLDDVITSVILPGLFDYKIVSISHTMDIWSSCILTRDTRMELVNAYMPDTYTFINQYSIKFNDSLIKATNSKDNLEQIYIKNLEPFMKGNFYKREDFQSIFLGNDSYSIINIINDSQKMNLLKHKGFQRTFMYAPHVIQNMLYLNLLQKWYEMNFKKKDFNEQYVVMVHELYMNQVSVIVKALKRSYQCPIFVNVNPTRFDILYNGNFYYSHHDIKEAIAIWFIIIAIYNKNELVDSNGERLSLDNLVPSELTKHYVNVEQTNTKLENLLTFINTDESHEETGIQYENKDINIKYNPINIKLNNQQNESISSYNITHEEMIQNCGNINKKNTGITAGEILDLRNRDKPFNSTIAEMREGGGLFINPERDPFNNQEEKEQLELITEQYNSKKQIQDFHNSEMRKIEKNKSNTQNELNDFEGNTIEWDVNENKTMQDEE